MTNAGRPYLHYTWFIHVVFLFGTMAPFISNACGINEGVWTKVFETDVNGSVVMGNQTELNAAVMTGARLRFVISAWGEAGYVGDFEYAAVESFISDLLCGQSVMRVSKNGWDNFTEDVYWKFFFICTSGYTYQRYFDVGSNLHRSENSSVNAVQWFMREPVSQIALLYRLQNGTTVSGNDDAVINAVLSGYDITTVYADVLPFFHSNDAVSPTGMVVGQNVLRQSIVLNMFFTMWSTDGVVDTSTWFADGTTTTESIETFRFNLKWYAGPCWREVYTHDEDGSVLNGSVRHLISAVVGGHSVKIVVGNFSMQVDNVRTMNGHVSAQLLDQLSKKDTQTFDEEDLLWIWQMAHTTGSILTRRYFVSNYTHASDTTEKKAISWFVDTHTWTNVLSTRRDGNVRSGSKTELRNAIQNGAAVRVALRFRDGHKIRRGPGRGRKGEREWFVMKADNLELSSTGEVAAQLIKIISTEEAGSNEFQIKDDPSWHFMIVTTQGSVEVSLWKVGDHVNDGRFSQKADVNWFVSY